MKDDGVNIILNNPISSGVYCLDSINLIVGDNGSGKTRLIKAIIRDLCNPGSEAEYAIDGVTEQLGVIYYTAAPFHKRMKLSKKAHVPFVDASPQTGKLEGTFAHDAREFLTISSLLGLTSRLEKPIEFKFDEIASKSVSGVFKYFFPDVHLPPVLEEMAQKFKPNTFKMRQVELQRRAAYNLRQNVWDSEDPNRDEELQLAEVTISHLNETSAQAEKEHRDVKSRNTALILYVHGPRTREEAIEWVAACCIDKTAALSAPRQVEFATRFLTRQFYNKFEDKFREAFYIVSEFIKEVERKGIGAFNWSQEDANISVNLPRLLSENISEKLLNDAARLGLVDLGFHSLSSGEAAITHQLASISRAIHEFASKGKKNFVVFIDEGDLLLHLSWQREYLNLIDQRLSSIREKLGLKSLQVVVATHSPLLTSDVLRDSITRLGEVKAKTAGFAAPLQKIVNYTFGTPAIGAIAEGVIDRLKLKSVFEPEDLSLLSQIEDEFIRNYLLKRSGRE